MSPPTEPPLDNLEKDYEFCLSAAVRILLPFLSPPTFCHVVLPEDYYFSLIDGSGRVM